MRKCQLCQLYKESILFSCIYKEIELNYCNLNIAQEC